MKIAINRCYGGFSLSANAVKRYLELQNKPCYFYNQTKYDFQDGKDEWVKCEPNEDEFCPMTTIQDMGTKFNECPKKTLFIMEILKEMIRILSKQLKNLVIKRVVDVGQ